MYAGAEKKNDGTLTSWLDFEPDEWLYKTVFAVKQDVKLLDLFQYKLKSIWAYLIKEDFQFFWDDVSPYWAGRFLDAWCKK